MDIYQEIQYIFEKYNGCLACGGGVDWRRMAGGKLSDALKRCGIKPKEIIPFFKIRQLRKATYVNEDGDLLFVSCVSKNDLLEAVAEFNKKSA